MRHQATLRTLRRALPWLIAMTLLLSATQASSGTVTVPLPLQAKLLAKVAGYDGNLASRSGKRVRVGVLTLPGNGDSERAATQLRRALGSIDTIGDLPHEEIDVVWKGGRALAETCRKQKLAIVYVTPGLDAKIGELRSALSGVNVLSVGAQASYVAEGVVLGFDLASGKPKLVVNLPQARAQKVNFSSRVLKLMKVIE